jgi:alpha-L-fucosidase
VLGQLAKSRSLGINYLLGIGPDAQGELHPDAYKNMAVLADWMKVNGEAVHAVKPLPAGESANVPATALGKKRFLFATREFRKNGKQEGMFDKDLLPLSDATLTLSGVSEKPLSVTLLGNEAALPYDFSGATVSVKLPAAKRSGLADVVQLEF